MSDPTIPRKGRPSGNAKQRAKVDGPSWGRLVDQGGGKIVLEDDRGNKWPSDKVIAALSSFGYDDEGFVKAPRPWVFAAGVPIVVGDCFIIHFLHGDPQKPFLGSAVRSLAPSDPTAPKPLIGSDPNRARARLGLKNAAGAMTGHVEISALDGGTNLEIVVGGPAYGTGLRLLLDFSSVPPTIKAGMGSETHPVPLGDVLVQAIKDLADDIVLVNAAHTGPTTAPVPVLNATTVSSDAALSLAAGAPMLSTIVKVQ
jgi:hypothetical protein